MNEPDMISMDVKVIDTGDTYYLEDYKGTYYGLGTLVSDFVGKSIHISIEVIDD